MGSCMGAFRMDGGGMVFSPKLSGGTLGKAALTSTPDETGAPTRFERGLLRGLEERRWPTHPPAWPAPAKGQ